MDGSRGMAEELTTVPAASYPSGLFWLAERPHDEEISYIDAAARRGHFGLFTVAGFCCELLVQDIGAEMVMQMGASEHARDSRGGSR